METEASKDKLATSQWWEGWAGRLAAAPGLAPEEQESYRRTLRAFQEFTHQHGGRVHGSGEVYSEGTKGAKQRVAKHVKGCP